MFYDETKLKQDPPKALWQILIYCIINCGRVYNQKLSVKRDIRKSSNKALLLKKKDVFLIICISGFYMKCCKEKKRKIFDLSLLVQQVHPGLITINVPLFKKLRDIIFLGGENHFMDNLGVKKVEAPSKCPEKWLIK